MYSSMNDPKVTITTTWAKNTPPPNHYIPCSPKVAQMVTFLKKIKFIGCNVG